MYKLNGKPIRNIRAGVTVGGVQYPWPISPETMARLGIVDAPDQPRPDDRYHLVTDNGDGTYAAERRPHDQIVAMIWEDAKRHRDMLTQTGGHPVEHDGATWWFHSDPYSLIRQRGLVTAAMAVQAAGGDLDAPLIPVPWKTLSGATVPMTATLALKLLPASMAQQGAIFARAEAVKAELEAAAEPETVDWRTGWPTVYEAPPALMS